MRPPSSASYIEQATTGCSPRAEARRRRLLTLGGAARRLLLPRAEPHSLFVETPAPRRAAWVAACPHPQIHLPNPGSRTPSFQVPLARGHHLLGHQPTAASLTGVSVTISCNGEWR